MNARLDGSLLSQEGGSPDFYKLAPLCFGDYGLLLKKISFLVSFLVSLDSQESSSLSYGLRKSILLMTLKSILLTLIFLWNLTLFSKCQLNTTPWKSIMSKGHLIGPLQCSRVCLGSNLGSTAYWLSDLGEVI